MKLLQGVVILAFLVSSIALGQERYPRPLSEVDLSGVRRSTPGAVPDYTMTLDSLVSGILHQVNQDSLIAFVRILSGEDSVQIGNEWVPIRKRGSYAGGNLAADYLAQKLGSYKLEVHDQSYSSYGRNVYAIQHGYLYPEKQYIICAHYDAVDLYCADDNASGVAAVLEAARILSKYDFKYTLVYALWDEEEEGFNGSRDYVARLASTQTQVQGVLNLDMLGWDGNQDGLVDIHSRNTANSNELANLLVIVNHLYGLQLKTVTYNPGTWQSDHSVFWEHGWGAILLMEAYYGGDLNPHYHGPDDRLSSFNLPYFHGISKLAIGAMAMLVEATTDVLLASVTPDHGYQTHLARIQVRASNTHFQESRGSLSVWLSRDSQTIMADSVTVSNNRVLDAYFALKTGATLGLWDVHVQDSMDGVITREAGFSIYPPPALIAVYPESLSISVGKGDINTYSLTIRNSGGSDLYYTISSSAGQKDLVAYYPFSGNATDQSVNGNDGTIRGATLSADRLGRPGEAYSFNGIDQWISVPYSPSLSLKEALTVGAWVNVESSTGDHQVILGRWYGSTGNGGTESTYLLEFQPNGNIVQMPLPGITTDNYSDAASTVPISFRQWHHVAGSYDGTNVRIYLDGVETSSLGRTGTLRQNDTPLFIGAHNVQWDRNPLKGKIDDIFIFSRALTDAEIARMMLYSSLFLGKTTVEPDTGVIAAGGSTEITVTIDANALEVGDYEVTVTISCNDPFKSMTRVPIHVTVTPPTGVDGGLASTREFVLQQNYPNPFNPSTTIRYELPKSSVVKLSVFDLLGREVSVLVNERRDAGVHEIKFDASGLSSGVYLYRLQAGGFVQSRKVLLVR